MDIQTVRKCFAALGIIMMIVVMGCLLYSASAEQYWHALVGIPALIVACFCSYVEGMLGE
jgi:hypothetical protein